MTSIVLAFRYRPDVRSGPNRLNSFFRFFDFAAFRRVHTILDRMKGGRLAFAQDKNESVNSVVTDHAWIANSFDLGHDCFVDIESQVLEEQLLF